MIINLIRCFITRSQIRRLFDDSNAVYLHLHYWSLSSQNTLVHVSPFGIECHISHKKFLFILPKPHSVLSNDLRKSKTQKVNLTSPINIFCCLLASRTCEWNLLRIITQWMNFIRILLCLFSRSVYFGGETSKAILCSLLHANRTMSDYKCIRLLIA